MNQEQLFLKFYAQENQNLQTELAKARSQLALAQMKLKMLQAQPQAAPSLFADGKEHDFYPYERREVLLDVLKNARKTIPDKTRRAAIVDDFLRTHPYAGEPGKRAKALKTILKGYRGLDDHNIRRKLRKLGFTTKDQHRKHWLLTYGDDPRFSISMTATGSDAGRGGKNLAADMIRRFL